MLCGALAIILITGLVSCGIRNDIVSKEIENKLIVINSLIKNNYLNEYEETDLEEELIKGYVNGLEDPYSVYYNEEETNSLMESVQGEYSGVGAVLSQNQETGVITITRVYQDSPAMKAGLKDGDILYKVGDMEVTGEDLSEVVTHIKGEKGTEVELSVYREGVQDVITVTAVRDEIEIETITYEMLDDQIGYILITEFEQVSCEQFNEALQVLDTQGMQGLIIDLRNNPGGSLSAVCDMADRMLPEGLIVYTEDKNGKREEFTSSAKESFDKPLVVLVNGYSASASEIFSAAMQDHEVGTIVGTQTYGKGVVQSIFDLKDGTCLKLTISEYFSPSGKSIHGKGVTPDVIVEYEANPNDSQKDNQLDKAMEVIKEKM